MHVIAPCRTKEGFGKRMNREKKVMLGADSGGKNQKRFVGSKRRT